MPIKPALAAVVENEDYNSYAFYDADSNVLWSRRKASKAEVVKALKANPPSRVYIARPDCTSDERIRDAAKALGCEARLCVYYPEGTVFDSGYDEYPYTTQNIARFAFGRGSDFIAADCSMNVVVKAGLLAVVAEAAMDVMREALFAFKEASEKHFDNAYSFDELEEASVHKKIIKALSEKSEEQLAQKLSEHASKFAKAKKTYLELLKVNERYASFLKGEYHIKDEEKFAARLQASYEKARALLEMSDEEFYEVCEALSLDCAD